MGNAFLIGVAVAVAMLASLAIARRTELPAPVFLVVAGLGVSFVPGVPDVILRPDVVFFVFLPPLLYSAAFFTTPRDLRANWLPITLLAVGLVLATLFAVAGAVAAGPVALGWGAAFGLGAIVSPTDPVAAGAVLSRLGAPERLRTILEGESLVNDGVALVVYALAVTSATGGGFSVAHGAARFFEMAAGGIALGIALGAVVAKVRRRVDDIEQEIVISLVTPYVAYVAAEQAGLSGVLATVATGVFLGWRSEGLFRPRTRLQANAFWEILTFLLESVLFVLLGAQLPVVLRGLGGHSPWKLAWWSLLVIGVVAGVRLVAHLAAPVSSWRQRLVLGWSGMRGAITLAAALALPLDFPHRNLVLFLAFTLVLGTLVAQGISLPYLVRALGLGAGGEAARRELDARVRMTEAALARVEELAAEGDAGAAALGPLRQQYESRLERLCSRAGDGGDGGLAGQYADAVREAIAAQRTALRQLQRERRLDLDATRRLRRELDLEESRLGGR